MAKSISHPDCVHCRFMVHHKNGEYRCHQHNMTLHTPVSLFCKMITVLNKDDVAYRHWFKNKLNPADFNGKMLYTWIETPIITKNGQPHVEIDSEPIAPLSLYRHWSAGSFWQVLRELRRAKRKAYRRQGHQIDVAKE